MVCFSFFPKEAFTPVFPKEFPLDADTSVAWEILSDFQNFERILPIKIQSGTDSNEPGSVRIFEMNSSIVVERSEKSDDELIEQIVLALTHFLEIDDLITNVRICDADDGVTLSLK